MYYNNSSNVTTSAREELGVWDIVFMTVYFVCIVCLTILTATYLFTKRRSTVSGQLMMNSCFAMMVQYTGGICNALVAASYSAVGCVVIALLSQWIFLAMLFAVAAQVLWVYLKLVRVFSAEPLHYSVKAIVVTWVVPLLWTVVSVAPNYRQYHRIHFFTCKATGYAFFIGILAPTVVLAIFVTAVATITIVSTCRAHCKRQEHHTNCHSTDAQAKQKRKLWLFLSLFIMMVIGWSSALVATEKTNIVVSVLAVIGHALFSAGQGVYLFLFAGVFNADIRQEWMKIIHCVSQGCRAKREDKQPPSSSV